MKIIRQLYLIFLIFEKCIEFVISDLDYKSSITTFFEVNKNSSQSIKLKTAEDNTLNFIELSQKYIRPAEEYDVTTEDGYILKLFRIPGNTSRAVLFCHGILCSSDDFLIRGNTSLFYLMAVEGFDVWAMNCRGNRYSRRHVTLNPDIDRQFWQYSMHEMGIYDYKAVIDFILQKAGKKQISVAAHSEGTSAFFILASERPEYNEKVKVFVGLAPITFVNNSGPTVSTLFKMSNTIRKILEVFNVEEFMGFNSSAKKLLDIVCSQELAGYQLCFNVLGYITGYNPRNIEQEFRSTILRHFPSGTSVKNLKHYANGFHQKRFIQYDYRRRNFAVYGSLKPPAYDLRKVTTKVALYAAKGDKIVGIKDIEMLGNKLRNMVHYHVINDDKFNHIDYMWGRNAHAVLYKSVINILDKYN